jgi:hypothetical protein
MKLAVTPAELADLQPCLEINPQAGLYHRRGARRGFCFCGGDRFSWQHSLAQTRRCRPITEDQDKMINQTLQIVKEAMSIGKKKNYQFLGFGLATPGTVDVNNGVLIFAPTCTGAMYPS